MKNYNLYLGIFIVSLMLGSFAGFLGALFGWVLS